MKLFSCITLIIFAISCKNPANKSENKKNPDSIVNVNPIFKPDTSGIAEKIYAVYELSPKTTAFVINFADYHEPKTFVDSIFEEVSSTDSIGLLSEPPPTTCAYFDTTGTYKLLKSKKLEKRLKPYFNNEFYIYGTHGVAKTTITDIVFGLDECITSIYAFCIDKSKIKDIGHPLICSRKLFDLKFDSSYKNIEKDIERLHASEKPEYGDSVKITVFGNVNNKYFAYSDDFLWGQNSNQNKCFFPSRIILTADKNGTLKRYWANGLDLFGIACD